MILNWFSQNQMDKVEVGHVNWKVVCQVAWWFQYFSSDPKECWSWEGLTTILSWPRLEQKAFANGNHKKCCMILAGVDWVAVYKRDGVWN